MVKITDEMRAVTQARIHDVCKKVDVEILKAVRERQNNCYFACDMDADADVYPEVARMYRAAGYRIYPEGLVGGVLQRTERIAW